MITTLLVSNENSINWLEREFPIFRETFIINEYGQIQINETHSPSYLKLLATDDAGGFEFVTTALLKHLKTRKKNKT